MSGFEVSIMHARSLLDQGALDDAEAALGALLKTYADHAVTWALRGELCHQRGQDAEAVSALIKASTLPTVTRPILINTARLLMRTKRWADAINYFNMALDQNQDDAINWRRTAICYARLGQWAEAEVHIRQSLRYAPESVPSLALLGNALDKLWRYTEASAAYEQALQLDPICLPAWQGLTKQALVRGDLNACLSYGRKMLALVLQRSLTLAKPSTNSRFDDPRIEAVMWRTLSVLAAAQIHAFPVSGTLLGLVREGHLLPFDKDLDFGLPFDEMATACSCLIANGWVEVNQDLRLVNPRGFYHPKHKVALDLCGFLVDTSREVVIGGFWQNSQPWSVQRVTEYPFPLRLKQVHRPEGYVWSLEDPEAWLVAVYGADWKIPDPDFDTVLAAKNLRGFSLLTQCYAFMRISRYWQDGRLSKALATTRHCLRHLPDDPLLLQAEAALAKAVSPASKKLTNLEPKLPVPGVA